MLYDEHGMQVCNRLGRCSKSPNVLQCPRKYQNEHRFKFVVFLRFAHENYCTVYLPYFLLFTMPPFASPDQLGFTGSLLTTLRESRAKLDAFIDDQMEQADAAAAAHEARVAQEQTFVDAQVSNLLQVELERGLYENGGNNEKAVGLAKRREELARQQDGVKQEIQSLQAKQTEQEKNLKGKYTIKPFFCLINCNKIFIVHSIVCSFAAGRGETPRTRRRSK